MQEATRKVILRLKEVRNQKRLTYQEIVDACEAQNESVSLSSVKRVFAQGSENGSDFRPYTLNAIFRAVIGTETEVEEEAALIDTENSALKAFVELKDAALNNLQLQLDAMLEENAALRRTIEELQIRLDTTTNIIRLAVESFRRE